ncbi:BF3164 family lipoprotein [Bacteroides sp. 51]|uniref:BF3164 family lipoprotein n=1 Tax=Bacteroides sp. 51 TaxID=2302938 RepID=UPI0013D3FC60|nr:BF3164 family lipoprotein [Bacteroides sp. 51]NDV81663.1 hypothetical protein [Bacteroides sp. 51]
MKFFLILFLIVGLCACNRTSGLFKNSKQTVVCEKIDIDFLIALNIELILQDSILLLNDFKLDPMITVLNLNNNSTVSTFLQKGEGPNDCIPPVQLQRLDDSIYILERQTAVLNKFQYSMINDGNVNLEKIWQSNNFPNTFVPLNDTVFMATMINSKSRFVLIDKKGEDVGNFGEYPCLSPGENGYDNISKSMFHQTFLLKKRMENKIAAMASHVLELYSYDEKYNFNLERQILFSKYEYSPSTSSDMNSITSSENTDRGAMCFYNTDKYIYVVYNPENERLYMHPEKRKNELWIFDWDGNPIKALLPDKDITTIAVDEKDNYIYGVDKNCELFRINIKI